MLSTPCNTLNCVPVNDVLLYNEPENDKTKEAKIQEIAAAAIVKFSPCREIAKWSAFFLRFNSGQRTRYGFMNVPTLVHQAVCTV